MNDTNRDLPTRQLVAFLRVMADDIEHGNISNNALKHAGEFYLSQTLETHTVKNPEDEYTDDEFKKFLTMGWYVYTQLNKQNTE